MRRACEKGRFNDAKKSPKIRLEIREILLMRDKSSFLFDDALGFFLMVFFAHRLISVIILNIKIANPMEIAYFMIEISDVCVKRVRCIIWVIDNDKFYFLLLNCFFLIRFFKYFNRLVKEGIGCFCLSKVFVKVSFFSCCLVFVGYNWFYGFDFCL